MRYKQTIAILILSLIVITCQKTTDEDSYRTEPIVDDFSDIADPQNRWHAYNLIDYVAQQQIRGFFPFSSDSFEIYVINNQLVDLIDLSSQNSEFEDMHYYFYTINDLFDLINSTNIDCVDIFEFEYDWQYGYPSYIYSNSDTSNTDGGYSGLFVQ